MDPQIISAVIGAIATIGAVVIGWRLQEKKSRTRPSVGMNPSHTNIAVPSQHTGESSNSNADVSSDSSASTVMKPAPITVPEIVEAINSAPPFQKDFIAQQYKGIVVKWTGYLKEAQEDFRDKASVRVNLNVERDTIVGPSFWFTDKTARFPEIRTLKRTTAICVVGEILSASGAGLYVDLKPISVEVLKDQA